MNDALHHFRTAILPRMEAAHEWEAPPGFFVTIHSTRWPGQRARVHAMLTIAGVRPQSVELGDVPVSAVGDALQGTADAMLGRRTRKHLRALGGQDVN